MILALLKTVILLVAFCVAQDPLHAMVPRTIVCTDVSDGLFSSPQLGRHVSIKCGFDSSDEAYPDITDTQSVGTLGVFRRFDLKDLAKSADIYSREFITPGQEGSPYTPEVLTLIPAWQGKNIAFDTVSSIRTERAIVAYSDALSLSDFSAYLTPRSLQSRLVEGAVFCFGASIPLIRCQSTNRYELNRVFSDPIFKTCVPAQDEKAERLRAQLFDQIGLVGNVWEYAGVGDLHAYAGIHTHGEYLLRLRSIDMGFMIGALLPSGMQRDPNYPSSLPFSLSSPAVTAQFNCDLGLKDYLHVGLQAGLLFERAGNHELRMPVYQEPAAYSPLIMTTWTEPGLTRWINPFLRINNIANNIHLTVNYAYVAHGKDDFKDLRTNPVVASVLTRNVSGNAYGTNKGDRDDAYNKLLASTGWRTRHAGVALTYEPYQADKNARINPLLTLGCQISHRGLNAPKMYYLFASASLQF